MPLGPALTRHTHDGGLGLALGGEQGAPLKQAVHVDPADGGLGAVAWVCHVHRISVMSCEAQEQHQNAWVERRICASSMQLLAVLSCN